MSLLATIRLDDVDPSAKSADYFSYKFRPAGRAIIFDGNNVALLHVLKHGYYMLPGGGIDAGEEIEAGLKREAAEELGCEIRIGREIGSVETYIDRWQRRQVDTCYVAYRTAAAENAQTEFEREEGHSVVWAPDLDAAIGLMEGANPANRDGQLVRARDLLFLQTAKKSK